MSAKVRSEVSPLSKGQKAPTNRLEEPNFQYNLDCIDTELAGRPDTLVASRLGHARRLGAAELHALTLPVRLRKGAVRLMSPYL